MKLEHNSRNTFYRFPFGAVPTGTEITLRLCAHNAGLPSSVKVVYTIGDDEEQSIEMAYMTDICGCCVYEARVIMPDKSCLVWYYFQIAVGDRTLFYANNSQNLGGIGEMYSEKPPFPFQITVYDKNYQTPEWFKDTVVYQIFVDRFFNGNEDGSFLGSRTDIIRRNWGDVPYYKAEQFGGHYLANDFFGGNLKGIVKKLPYLADLGVGAIYLNPIFKAYSNHKYDTGDYKQIDPMFGSNEDFKALCEEAAKYGIRVILDGVFNHTGSDSKYFNKYGSYDSLGAYQSKDSPYYSWYRFIDYPDVYESWWGIDSLPHVDESSPDYQRYILTDKDAVVKLWLKMGAYGWRLDVVDELPDFFVKKLRTEVKKQNKDAVIIGEVWEDASNKISYGQRREYLLGDELDSVMNYPLRNSIVDFALGKIDASGFDARIMSLKENYPPQAFYSLLNILSTHDVERILTVLGNVPSRSVVSKDYQAGFSLSPQTLEMAKARLFAAVAMQMLLPGVPCIYYGDEAGMQGYADPFCRATYPWGHEDKEIQNWYKKMISIRNNDEIFKKGDMETVYKIGRVYAFLRILDGKGRIVLVSFADHPETVRLDVARFGIYEMKNMLDENEEYFSDDGIFHIDMQPNLVKIFI